MNNPKSSLFALPGALCAYYVEYGNLPGIPPLTPGGGTGCGGGGPLAGYGAEDTVHNNKHCPL